MKKRLVSALLCAALVLSSLPAASAAFTDISDANTTVAAATLQGLGIVNGTSATTFHPNGTLTRAQACTMVVNAMGLSSQVNTHARKTLFTDVPSSAWYNGYVNLAYAQGVINGYGNGTFGPDDPITYGQLATILLRMLKYTSAEIGSVWPMDYTAFAEDLGLSDGLSLSPMGVLTRGQAAVLFYRTLNATVNGTSKAYYQTISGVTSTSSAILLDVSASYGNSDDLVMAYTLGTNGGIQYYAQVNEQSSSLTGSIGTLLFDGTGRVKGFIPESSGSLDLTVESATASSITAASGTSYRISAGATVISGGTTYPYSTTGYLQVHAKAGERVRLYYDTNGAINYLYLAGGADSSEAAVASTTSAASALARELGISGQSYAITKNGVTAAPEHLAQYDVGYYDAASNTLRVSDYRVSGYLSAATPSVTAATAITIAGHTFDVLECAWATLGQFSLGDRVTLLLTDNCKVAAAYTPSKLAASMLGVLDKGGRSVTLVDSGITLSGSFEYEDSALGGLVTISTSSASTIHCTGVSETTGLALDLNARTLGKYELAPSCAIYEWAGGGYVYDLEGNPGASSSDFSAIPWTDRLSASYISYYHTNSAGQVDVILLKDVTGSAYDYGKFTLYTDKEGISLGSEASNPAATLTNSSGTSSKYLCNVPNNGNTYVGIALGHNSLGYGRVMKLQPLNRLNSLSSADFFQQDGDWYVAAHGTEYRISTQVELYVDGADSWLSGSNGLESILADDYSLTLYYDRAPSAGGQIRIIHAS